jgi:hypothetical protein
MRHGSPRVDRVRGRFRNQLSERKHHTTGTSTRGGSGVLAGRCVLYPPHSTPLLPADGIVSTELVNSRIVGNPEVTVGLATLPTPDKSGYRTCRALCHPP